MPAGRSCFIFAVLSALTYFVSAYKPKGM
ncbi:MAG: KleE stable inheritance protein [Burkholderiaceae bacterium]